MTLDFLDQDPDVTQVTYFLEDLQRLIRGSLGAKRQDDAFETSKTSQDFFYFSCESAPSPLGVFESH
jgi:hypothetical protein